MTEDKYKSWPLKNIKDPSPNDVLYGRGGGTNHHPGNKRYRKWVEDRKVEYVNSKRLEKPIVALEVVKKWREQSPPGRFLKVDDKTGLWNDVEAQSKGQAHVGGYSQWDFLNVEAGKDLIIAKRIDYAYSGLITAIYADGQKVGEWKIEGQDRKFRWRNWLLSSVSFAWLSATLDFTTLLRDVLGDKSTPRPSAPLGPSNSRSATLPMI